MSAKPLLFSAIVIAVFAAEGCHLHDGSAPGLHGGGVQVANPMFIPALDREFLWQQVVDRFTDRYGDLVIVRDSIRTDYGEVHRLNRVRGPYQIGLDVVIEAWALASTSCLIHGVSNVSSFVLCLNPDLESEDIYEPYYEDESWRE